MRCETGEVAQPLATGCHLLEDATPLERVECVVPDLVDESERLELAARVLGMLRQVEAALEVDVVVAQPGLIELPAVVQVDEARGAIVDTDLYVRVVLVAQVPGAGGEGRRSHAHLLHAADAPLPMQLAEAEQHPAGVAVEGAHYQVHARDVHGRPHVVPPSMAAST